MTTQMLVSISGWLMTVALQGGLLLLVAWIIDRIRPTSHNTWRELMWRFALFGGVLTASAQMIAGQLPFAGRWHLAAVQMSSLASVESARDMQFTAVQPAIASSSIASSPSASADSPPALRAKPADDLASHASVTQSRAAPPAVGWPGWIIGIWLLGALFALTRMARSLLQLRRALCHVVALPGTVATSDFAALAKRAAVHAPRLYSLADIASPIAVAGKRVIVPVWAIESLDRRQLRAMFAHELAHIARRDPQWKLLGAFWRALFWFLPLAGVAQRRLDELAELACDAFAARHTGNAHSVAECLAACAEHHTSASVFELAPAMAGRKSPLMHRIDCLLEGVSMETFTPGARTRAVAATALAVCVFSLPAVTFFNAEVAHAAQAPQKEQTTVKHDTETHSSLRIDDDGGRKMSVRVSDLSHQLSVNVDGKIAFNADETDVASLSAGGTATFEETRAGVTRRVEFAERAGKLERRYFVDQHEQPFDATAGAWLGTLLPELAREAGIAAAARVQRFYAAGGAARVLDEIGLIHSDYVRGIYLGLLVDRGQLAPTELDRTLKLAGELGSDYERHQAMSRIFAKQTLAVAQQVTFLRQAAHFDSDYERAELLIEVGSKMANSADVRQAWLDAALGVSSDYERRRTLQSMLTRKEFDDSQLASVISASDSMGSDYERRELLVAIARQAHDIDALAPAYARSTQAMGSDYERREALLALMSAGKFGPGGAKAVLDATAQMGSDYECREVLLALARVMPRDDASVQHYRQVAQRLSDSDREAAENALKR